MIDNIWYVYRHIRLDKNEPFYIGIGHTRLYKRAYRKVGRNLHWKNIVNKTEYRVEIIFDSLSKSEAITKEREFIKLYGREDLGLGSLCNLTDGGEGTERRICKEETKEKLRIVNSQYRHTPEAIEKIRKATKNISNETREKMAMSKKGKPRDFSPITLEKLRLAATNISEETRRKRSEALKGRTFSPETLQRMSDSAKKRFQSKLS